MSSREDRDGPGGPGDSRPDRQAFQELDAAVGRTVERLDELRREVAWARSRVAELEELLQRFSEDEEAPGRMRDRLEILERENGDMRSRLLEGRETLERLLARIRFLEEQR